MKKSIDDVYHKFCLLISGNHYLRFKTLSDLIIHEKKISTLEKEISKLKSEISRTKQFNHKVELNQKLKALEKDLIQISGFQDRKIENR